jgi:hypothetical protein
MPGFNLNYGNPGGYADWTQYAGFDPNTPITGIGISPPAINQNTTSSMSQAVVPTMGDIGQRATDVFDQLKQGNLGQAVKTYQFGKPMAKTQKPTFPVDDGMVTEHQD